MIASGNKICSRVLKALVPITTHSSAKARDHHDGCGVNNPLRINCKTKKVYKSNVILKLDLDLV